MPLALLAFLFAADVGPPSVAAVKTSRPPLIDGRLDDEAWRGAAPTGGFTQSIPFDGREPSERTTFRVLYDDEALYVGFDCEQIHTPIIERLTRRDQDSESEWVNVQIDPRSEGKAVLSFGINVSGVLIDALITPPYNWNADWDENWEARAAKTSSGWSAEFRIPFRVIRFDGTRPIQSWGFQAGRYIAHNQETDVWSHYARDVATPLDHAGRLEGLTGLGRTGALELRPFVTGDVRRLDTTDETSASGYDAEGSVGLDLKWHIAQDLVLDGAIRPDFGQVEADQVILNLTNYETFLPEKRPLFLEGTDVFSFPLQLFYSRRIGFAPTNPTLRTDTAQMLVNVPAPATIYGAAKVVGRLGSNWTIGALTAVTSRNEVTIQDPAVQTTSSLLVAPLTAYNAVRLRREWGSTGHVGLIATATTTFETNGGYAVFLDPKGNQVQLCPSGATTTPGARCFRDSYVAGADALWRSPSGDYVANGAVIESFIHAGPQSVQLDGTSIGPGAHSTGGWARLAKEGGKHVLASATYTGLGRQVDYNDLGFMPRQNLHELIAAVGYRTLDPGFLTLDTTSNLQVAERRSFTGLELGQVYELNTRLRFANYWTVGGAVDLAPARFDDREIGNGAALERADYLGARIDLATDPKRNFVFAISAQAGAIRNQGRAYTSQVALSLSPAPQLSISLIPQATLSEGEPRYTSQTTPSAADPLNLDRVFGKLKAVSVGATLRASYTFAPRLTLQMYAQAFLASGHFDDLRALPAAPGQRIRIADITAAPQAQLGTTPDFEQAALNLNVVLRWEYRLGSTLFFVYSRSQVPGIANFSAPGSLEPGALGTRASADVLLLKLSYWWSS